MSAVKHTPGPWNVSRHNDLQYSLSKAIEGYEEVDIADEEDEANAKLIAAAPELLEAVRELRNQLLTIQMNIPSIMPLGNEQRNRLSASLLQSEKAIDKATT